MSKLPPTERIASSFKNLAAASTKLNAATKDLGKTISILDSALASLDISVSAWHEIAGNADAGGEYWSRDIGYAKVGRKWGIAIRKTHGHEAFDDHDEEVWLFNEAPAWMQAESVSRLPDLIDELIKRTDDTTNKIKSRTTEVQELAAAVQAVLSEVNLKRK